MSNPTSSSTPAAPWWKFGHVWLVVSGPLIVVVENNGYAYSTPTARQMKIRDLAPAPKPAAKGGKKAPAKKADAPAKK